MSFLTAEKKDHVARCPAARGGKTYLGNARLKSFFFIWTPSLTIANTIAREVDWVNSGGEQIPSQQPSPSLKPEHWALV